MNLAPNRIPAEPVIAVLNEHLGSDAGWSLGEPADTLETLADRADMHKNTLERMLNGRSATIDFDMADRLLCAAGKSNLWWGPLREVYETASLSPPLGPHVVGRASGARTCARHGCSVTFIPPKKAPYKRFCSSTCKAVDWKQRKNGVKSRIRGPGRVLEAYECRNGHVRTPKNTGINCRGTRYCLICHRERTREHRARKKLGLA